LATTPPALPIDPGVLQPLLDGLLGKYGWLTTALLVIGSLRILFKPVMLIDRYGPLTSITTESGPRSH